MQSPVLMGVLTGLVSVGYRLVSSSCRIPLPSIQRKQTCGLVKIDQIRFGWQYGIESWKGDLRWLSWDDKPARKRRLAACATSRLVEASGFVIVAAVLQDDSVSRVDGHPGRGLRSVVGEQFPDEPRLENEAHSRVEPLLPDVTCSADAAPRPVAQPVDEAHSRVEPLLPDVACSADAASLRVAQPVDEAHSRVEPLLPDVACSADAAWLPVCFPDEVCFHAELCFLPHEACFWNQAHSPSQSHPVDEVHHCALLECCARHCRVEERCSPEPEPAYPPTAWLLHDWL